jgi:hypothetical protein
MQKTLKVLNVFEDSTSGAQVFQIHERDPDYKIDRIVYREKSPYGWFKEITSEDYLRKVKHLRPISYWFTFCEKQIRNRKLQTIDEIFFGPERDLSCSRATAAWGAVLLLQGK